MMIWLLLPPSHFKAWYELCTIGMYLSFLCMKYNNNSHISFEEWLKVKMNSLLLLELETWTWKLFIRQEKNTNMTQYHTEYMTVCFFFVGRPLQRRWAHRLRKGHPRLLQCINRHCTMKGQTFGSVGKLNTHTSWDRVPSRLTRGTQLTIIMRGKETKTSVLHTTS